MSNLTSGMVTDLSKRAVLMFTAVEIVLPAYTVRLLDGAGFAVFGGHTFTGRDANGYGVLGAIDEYADGVDDEAPSRMLSILQADNTALAAYAAPTAQGSLFSVWTGDINPATGAVIADPDLEFVGELDTGTQKVSARGRVLELQFVSIFERFFDQDEGFRLNNGFHKSVWSGETGLEFIPQVQGQRPWGADAPRSPLTTFVPQGGGGGGLGPGDLRNLLPF